MAIELRARCAKPVEEYKAEHCWVCGEPLCTNPCWEEFGVCVATACCALQNELLNAKTNADRTEIMNRPGPIGATRARRRQH